LIETKSNSDKNIVFKNLTWFLIASLSLIFSGFLLSENKNLITLSLLIWCNLIGVFLAYRLNDCIDQHKHLTFNIKSFLSFPIHKFVFFQFILLVIPISFYFINFFTFFILGISAIVGVLYSISFKIGNTRFRLKNIFLVKNFLIGIIWGNLILIGAGSISNKEILTLFVFVSIQVFIGGIIRDIPDLKKDKEANVRSFPVVFGTAKTILFLQIINLSSLAVLVIGEFSFYNLIFILIVVFWRAINLVFLKRQPFRKLWSQSANLFTCLLIFILIFTIKYVHYIF
jgi:hypothetical protein